MKLLRGLIPNHWEEETIEFANYYECHVLGEQLSDKAWDEQCNKLTNEFGDKLMEIYSNTCYGVNFIVYLRKTKKK